MATNIPYDTMSTTSRSESLFTKCCCCIPLRIGCFILGYLSLFYNCYRTISAIALTTFWAISTHGFNHIDRQTDANYSDESTDDNAVLQQIGMIFIVILIVNLIWLLINIACLVGLHKKRSGPVRVFVGCASFRLTLATAGFIYLVVTGQPSTHVVISHIIDLSVTGYFILVYYIYAMQLEREMAQQIPKPTSDAESINDISFIYPKTLSEKHLIA